MNMGHHRRACRQGPRTGCRACAGAAAAATGIRQLQQPAVRAGWHAVDPGPYSKDSNACQLQPADVQMSGSYFGYRAECGCRHAAMICKQLVHPLSDRATEDLR
jgi:hypothetical protein